MMRGWKRAGLALAMWTTSVAMPASMAALAQPAPKTVIREAFPSRTSAQWINMVAQAEGFYAKENLVIEEHVLDPNIIVTALIGQAVDIGWAEATAMVIAIDKGVDLVAFGLSTYRQPYKFISTPEIKTLADMKGRRIGVSSAIDVYTYVIKQLLVGAKLDPEKDVEWIVGGNSARRLAAIVGGGMDAGLFSPPADSRLQRQGFNVLAFTPDLYPTLTLSATATRRDWAEKNGETLKRYLRAQTNAAKWLMDPSNKTRAIQILAEVSGSTIPDAEEAYTYFAGTDVWTSACINRPGLESVVRILRITQQISKLAEADVAKFALQDWCSVK